MTSSEMPAISVIVPAYNSADYIATALKSIEAQRYPNVQVIVVDDGSSDETKHIVAKQPGEITFVSQSNAGPAAARNTGLALATGPLVAFLDADDWFLPQKFRQQVEILNREPSIDAVHAGWDLVNTDGETFQTIEPWHQACKLDLRDWIIHKPVRLGAMLFRRECLQRVNGFDPALRQAEDTDLMFRLALAGCRFRWQRESTLCYRHHDASVVRSRALEQAECNVRVLDKLFDNAELPRSIRRLEPFTRYYLNLWVAWQLFRTGHANETVRFLQATMLHAPHPSSQTVPTWHSHFAHWSAGEGADPGEVRSIWPQFRKAAGIDDNHWPTLAAELDWWLRVWRHYADGNFEKGKSQLAKNRLSASELASRISQLLLHCPYPARPDAALRLWEDAEQLGWVDAGDRHRATALHLGVFGRACWRGEAMVATSALLSAASGGHQRRAWPIWGQFVQSSVGYLRFRMTQTVSPRKATRRCEHEV